MRKKALRKTRKIGEYLVKYYKYNPKKKMNEFLDYNYANDIKPYLKGTDYKYDKVYIDKVSKIITVIFSNIYIKGKSYVFVYG